MPSHLRYIASLAACHNGPLLRIVVALHADDGEAAGADAPAAGAGQAAPAA
jgi:hypothetical protein